MARPNSFEEFTLQDAFLIKIVVLLSAKNFFWVAEIQDEIAHQCFN